MIVVERLIQQIRPNKWLELEALDKRYNVIESRHGFPAKKRYRTMVSSDNSNTLVIEREWPSMAAMEAAYEQVFADPEWNALDAEAASIIKSNRNELYAPLP